MNDDENPDELPLEGVPLGADEPLPVEDEPQEEPWQKRTNHYYRDQLQEITHGRLNAAISNLRTATHPRLRHPLKIVAFSGPQRRDDIPVDPAFYARTQFRVGSAPTGTEGVILDHGLYGYDISGGFRRIGAINFLRLNGDDVVEEAVFGSEIALEHFKQHLFGRKLAPEERERIRQIQERTFEYLRSDPEARARLKRFAESRHWPEEFEDMAKLAYFHDRVTPLREWAASQGFTEHEMILAGWYEVNFTNSGVPSYSVRDANVIRIPYFKNGRTEVWRTRNLNPVRSETHKYTSWPLDRSIERQFDVSEKLYYGWRLHEARGKPLVVTEGEFKCLIATHLGGTLTVGIPGITEVDDTIIQALLRANASKYIIILDRDPIGKGLMRVDGITDSQRAAFQIATRLHNAGARNVFVGQIPNVRQGEKVGVDDLILDQGAQAFHEVMARAHSPAVYAKSIGLNMTFDSIMRVRQRLGKALEHYENSRRRGGPILDKRLHEEATEMHERIQALYSDFLAQRYFGARRIDQPQHELAVHFRSKNIEDAENKLAITRSGNGIALDKFNGDIAYFRFHPKDTPEEFKWGGSQDLVFPITTREIVEFHDTGNGGNYLRELLAHGYESIYGEAMLGQEQSQYPKPKNSNELGTLIMAGYLARWFPMDEYRFEQDLKLCTRRDTHWEELTQVPLTIFRRSTGEAIGFAALPVWDGGDINDALSQSHRLFNHAASFLRSHKMFGHQQDKYAMVMKTIWPFYFDQNRASTIEAVAQFGISSATVDRYQPILLTHENAGEMMDHFIHKRLLNQATYAGLFQWDSEGRTHPRFKGDVLLLPVYNNAGEIKALRVCPLELRDHLPPALDPDPKLVRHLYGTGRELITVFNPRRHIYMQEQLSTAAGQDVLMAAHELDGLALASLGRPVVALNSSFDLHEDVITGLINSYAKSIRIVISGAPPRSKYDNWSFNGTPGFYEDIYDLSKRINDALPPTSPLPIYVSVISHSATALLAAGHDDIVTAYLDRAVKIDDYLKKREFNPAFHDLVRRFLATSSRLQDYLEVSAYPDMLDGKPIDWWVRESKRLHSAISGYVQSKYGKAIPSVETYFQNSLGLAEPVAVEELVRLRREEDRVFICRPVYSYIDPDLSRRQGRIPEHLWLQFEQVMQPGKIALDMSAIMSPTAIFPAAASQVAHVIPDNPKGRLLQIWQSNPHKNSKPQFLEKQVDGRFECVASMTKLDGAQVDVSGLGIAPRKKEAEALASQNLLEKIARMLGHPVQETIVEPIAPSTQAPHPINTNKNAKVYVFEYLQRLGMLNVVHPVSRFKKMEREFICDVTLTLDGQVRSFHGAGRSKRGAETVAFTQSIPHLPQTPPPLPVQEAAPVTTAVDNPKGRVFEYLQTHGLHETIKPVSTFQSVGTAFKCNAELAIGDRTYKGEGVGKGKKEAEAVAFRKIYRSLNDNQPDPDILPAKQRVSAGTDPMSKIRALLIMDAGDKNYIGQLGRIAQAAQVRQPEYESQGIEGAKEHTWKTRVEIYMPDGAKLESDACESESKKESRQAAAYSLLTKIFDHLETAVRGEMRATPVKPAIRNG